eukprot:1141293-Pelagomonas_calceolata.AAC.1
MEMRPRPSAVQWDARATATATRMTSEEGEPGWMNSAPTMYPSRMVPQELNARRGDMPSVQATRSAPTQMCSTDNLHRVPYGWRPGM